MSHIGENQKGADGQEKKGQVKREVIEIAAEKSIGQDQKSLPEVSSESGTDEKKR